MKTPLKIRFRLLLLIILSIVTISCLKNDSQGIPDDVIDALNRSGIKKPGLMSVILEFQEPKDTLKLEAAYFLLKNLENNYTADYYIADSNDNEILVLPDEFGDYKSIVSEKKKLELSKGKLSIIVDTIILDKNLLSPEQLIDQINNTYENWFLVDSSIYNFETYSNYILPYRVANEWPEDLPPVIHDKLGYLQNKYPGKKYLSDTINKLINNHFKVDDRLRIKPNASRLSEILRNSIVSQLDINIMKIKALRCVGIAASLDYTPYFSDSISGYYTTTVLFPDGSSVNLDFIGNDSLLYNNHRIAKVYRRRFSCTDSCLFTIKEDSTHTPLFMGDYCYEDVTSKYRSTKDTTLHLSVDDRYCYLAINNEDKLRPIAWSLNKNGNADFKALGIGIEYTPVVYRNDSIIKIGESFILEF